MDSKWLRTTEIFDEYERRFAAARAEKKLSRFPEDRETVLAGVKKMLCWNDALMPEVGDLQEQIGKDAEKARKIAKKALQPGCAVV